MHPSGASMERDAHPLSLLPCILLDPPVTEPLLQVLLTEVPQRETLYF